MNMKDYFEMLVYGEKNWEIYADWSPEQFCNIVTNKVINQSVNSSSKYLFCLFSIKTAPQAKGGESDTVLHLEPLHREEAAWAVSLQVLPEVLEIRKCSVLIWGNRWHKSHRAHVKGGQPKIYAGRMQANIAIPLSNATEMVYRPNKLASQGAAHSWHVLCSSCATSKCDCQDSICKINLEYAYLLLQKNKGCLLTETAGLWHGCTWHWVISINFVFWLWERTEPFLRLRGFHFSALQNHTHAYKNKLPHTAKLTEAHRTEGVRTSKTKERNPTLPSRHAPTDARHGTQTLKDSGVVLDSHNDSVWMSEGSYIDWQWRLSIVSTLLLSISLRPTH